MALRYLLDEHIDPAFRTQLVHADPDLIVWIIGDPGAPLRGTLDPDILVWCENNGFLLVTTDVMPSPKRQSIRHHQLGAVRLEIAG